MVGGVGIGFTIKNQCFIWSFIYKIKFIFSQKCCIILFKQKAEKRISFYDEFKAQRTIYTIRYRLLEELTIIATQITFNVDRVVFVKIQQHIK